MLYICCYIVLLFDCVATWLCVVKFFYKTLSLKRFIACLDRDSYEPDWIQKYVNYCHD